MPSYSELLITLNTMWLKTCGSSSRIKEYDLGIVKVLVKLLVFYEEKKKSEGIFKNV